MKKSKNFSSDSIFFLTASIICYKIQYIKIMPIGHELSLFMNLDLAGMRGLLRSLVFSRKGGFYEVSI